MYSSKAYDDTIARLGTPPATAERQVLLCTDLHVGIVLAAEREPWLMIDPKPYGGDLTTTWCNTC